MSAKDNEIEKTVMTELLRLNATIQGITTGLVAGLGIFIATNWLLLKGGEVIGPHLALLGHFFIGYDVTFIGSLIGCGYGMVLGFVLGYSVAKMYNWMVDLRDRSARRAPRG